jgi:hypothetical protein
MCKQILGRLAANAIIRAVAMIDNPSYLHLN